MRRFKPDRKDWNIRSLPIVIDWEGKTRVVASQVPRFFEDERLAVNDDGTISFMARFTAQGKTRRVNGVAVQKEDGKWHQVP